MDNFSKIPDMDNSKTIASPLTEDNRIHAPTKSENMLMPTLLLKDLPIKDRLDLLSSCLNTWVALPIGRATPNELEELQGSFKSLECSFLSIRMQMERSWFIDDSDREPYSFTCYCGQIISLDYGQDAWEIVQNHDHLEGDFICGLASLKSQMEVEYVEEDEAWQNSEEEEIFDDISEEKVELKTDLCIKIEEDNIKREGISRETNVIIESKIKRQHELFAVMESSVFIQNRRSTGLFCLLCLIAIPGEKNIKSHCSGRRHKNNQKDEVFIEAVISYTNFWSSQDAMLVCGIL